MPQGTVIAVRPSLVAGSLSSDSEWLENFGSFIQESTGEEFDVGVLEVCDTEGDSELSNVRKMLFIIPKGELPPDIETGNCEESKATKVKFFYKKEPFKYIDKIKSKE